MKDGIFQHEFEEYGETHIFLRLLPFDDNTEARLEQILDDLLQTGQVDEYVTFVRDRDAQYWNYASNAVYKSNFIVRLTGDKEAFKRAVEEVFEPLQQHEKKPQEVKSRAIKRDLENDFYVDLEDNIRVNFNVASGLDKEKVEEFILKFVEKHKNEDSVWWGESAGEITQFSVMVGYAQAFQSEFENEFNEQLPSAEV